MNGRLLAIAALSVALLPATAGATPPTRPVEVLPLGEAIADGIRATDGAFLVPLTVTAAEGAGGAGAVRVEIVVTTADEVDRREAGRSEERFDIGQRGEIEVKIPVIDSDGVFRVDIAVGTAEGAVFDREVLYQVTEPDGTRRLVTHQQWRDRRSEDGLRRFRETRSVADLHERAAPIDGERAARTEPGNPDTLLVRPPAISPGDVPFVQDRSRDAWRARDPLTIRGQYVFTDFDGVQRPVINASVYVYDDDTFGDEYLGSAITDWNGDWSFSVNNDDGFLANGRDIYVTMKLENTRWEIKDNGDVYGFTTEVHDDLNDGTVLDFGTRLVVVDTDAAQIHNFINRAWNHATTVGGRDPGFVAVEYPGTGDFFNGEVNLSSSTNTAPDIAIHEYGHFLMESAYPGGDPSPGGAHGFGDNAQDRRLSWSEGFASAFMLSSCNDGQYNWDEGTSEGAGEWPACTTQSDTGGQELELFSDDNRTGELNEGRVAAALLDFFDFDNDDNGGIANRGAADKEDANSGNTVSLEVIYNDVMWGSGHNDMLEFWRSLAGELVDETLADAGEIMQYNYMSEPLSIEIDCVASKIALAEVDGASRILDQVRAFRDEGLKPLVEGRALIRAYYRHSPEMAMLLLGDERARADAVRILRHAALMGQVSRSHVALERLARRNADFLPADVAESAGRILELIEKQGSPELRQDAELARRVIGRFAGVPFNEAVAMLDGMARGDEVAKGEGIGQHDLAPASLRADWERIREALPEGLRPVR
jgi:hypothetical protein